MSSMDDSTIGTLLRSGDEKAPAELRDAVAAEVRRDMRPDDDRGEPSRRRFAVGVSVAAAIVLLIVGLAVVGTTDDDQAPATDTTLPTTSPSTPAPTSTAPTSTAATTVDAEVDRRSGLPDADPVTIAARPGVIWPLPDTLPDGYVLVRAEAFGGDRRQLTYFPAECDPSQYWCDQQILIGLSDGVEDQNDLLAIPLTSDGDVWVWWPPDDPDNPGDELQEYRACLTDPACDFVVHRRLEDVLVDVERWGLDVENLTEIALGVRLVDETELPRPPMRLHDDDFGPVVAATPDGIELRAVTNGVWFELTPAGGDGGYMFYRTEPDEPVRGAYDLIESKPFGGGRYVIFGLADPRVVELVFEFRSREEPVTLVPSDLTGTFRHQFFITEIERDDLKWRNEGFGTIVHALDASGNELATYGVEESGYDLFELDR